MSKLKDASTREALSLAFDSLDLASNNWDDFKKQVYDQGVNVLGLKEFKHRDWFNDNSVVINQLLDMKRKAHQKLLNCKPGAVKDKISREFSKVRSHVQKRLRQIKKTVVVRSFYRSPVCS